MEYKVTLTEAQWKLIDETCNENIIRFSGWLADHYADPEANKTWLTSVKMRYEAWKDVQKSLLDGETISD